MRELSNGEYYNECLENSTTWRQDYWSDYSRLVEIKQSWDPDNVFYCKQCAGAVDQSSGSLVQPVAALVCLMGALLIVL